MNLCLLSYFLLLLSLITAVALNDFVCEFMFIESFLTIRAIALNNFYDCANLQVTRPPVE